MKAFVAILAMILLATLLSRMHDKSNELEYRVQRLESFCDHQIDINRRLLTNDPTPAIFLLEAE